MLEWACVACHRPVTREGRCATSCFSSKPKNLSRQANMPRKFKAVSQKRQGGIGTRTGRAKASAPGPDACQLQQIWHLSCLLHGMACRGEGALART